MRIGRGDRRARRADRLPAAREGDGRRRRQGHARRPSTPRPSAAASRRRRARGRPTSRDASVYVERYLEDPRHVEVQILADAHGNVIHLGERDCTIQRRHQKLVEESPSPAVDARAARAHRARSPSTLARAGRLPLGRDDRGPARRRRQVLLHGDEHAHPGRAHGDGVGHRRRPGARADPRRRPASRCRCGRRTSSCAATRSSAASTRRIRRGGFRPSPGTHHRSTASPAGPGVRVDSGVTAGSEVSELYDPMVAKLIVHDVDRERARRRMLRALEEFEIGGVKTLVGFHRALLSHPCFVARRDVPRRRRVGGAGAGVRRLLSPPVVGRRMPTATSRAARSRSSSTAAASRSRCSARSRRYRELARRREERGRRTATAAPRTRSSARCRAR